MQLQFSSYCLVKRSFVALGLPFRREKQDIVPDVLPPILSIFREEYLRGFYDPPCFSPTYRVKEVAGTVACPFLDFNEDEGVPPRGDNVDLSLTGPEVSGQNPPALQLEEGRSLGLPRPSKG